MPKWTNLMALTAMANLATRKMVIRNLEMNGCYVLARNPNKKNIRYAVAEKHNELVTIISPIVINVIEKGQEADRCILLCRSYKDSSELFELLIIELERSGVLITNTESEQALRNCEKFTACLSPNTKRKIIASFTHPDGLVLATVAFGMGLDSPNVRTVIHWGPPEDLESYVQETSRGGHDNMLSHAILYYNRRDIAANSHASDEVRRYCENMSECRRALLMRQFTDEALDLPLHGHLCCDVCASICTCEGCDFNTNSDMCASPQPVPFVENSHASACTVPKTIQETLKEQLVAYRMQLSKKFTHATALVGIELCTGLTDHTITNIASTCLSITCEDDILKCGVTSRVYCSAIFEIVNNTVMKMKLSFIHKTKKKYFINIVTNNTKFYSFLLGYKIDLSFMWLDSLA